MIPHTTLETGSIFMVKLGQIQWYFSSMFFSASLLIASGRKGWFRLKIRDWHGPKKLDVSIGLWISWMMDHKHSGILPFNGSGHGL